MMNETAKAARREYYRRWRSANPDKVKATQQRYWMRKAEQLKAEETRAAIVATDPGQHKTATSGN